MSLLRPESKEKHNETEANLKNRVMKLNSLTDKFSKNTTARYLTKIPTFKLQLAQRNAKIIIQWLQRKAKHHRNYDIQ